MNPSHDERDPFSRFLELPAGSIHYLEWGERSVQSGGGRVIVLLHGTAFAAGLWDPVARRLVAEGYSVLALDRRGHGRTAMSSGAFDFEDFADDLIAFTGALDLEGVHGIGHSAGATDLLLAAARRPERFATVLAMEPTIMDPDRSRTVEPGLSPASREYLDRVRARRSQWPGRQEAREHFLARTPYSSWRSDVFELFLDHALEETAAGLQLRCRAEDEASMLEPILRVMERRYRGRADGEPFGALRRVACPVMLIANKLSLPYYHMTKFAEALVPGVRAMIEWELGHCSPMEDPPTVAGQILSFVSQHGSDR